MDDGILQHRPDLRAKASAPPPDEVLGPKEPVKLDLISWAGEEKWNDPKKTILWIPFKGTPCRFILKTLSILRQIENNSQKELG